MSSVQRILSASAATWVRILLAGASQVLLVPIFLSHWSVEQYGCWLIIQALFSFSSIVSMSHQNYVGFEFLKIGSDQPNQLSRMFYSALPLVVLVAVAELSLLAALTFFGCFDAIFDANHSISRQPLRLASWSLLIYASSWLLSSSAGGLASRLLTACGYYPRVTWWNTFITFVVAVASAGAVALGAGLLGMVACVTAAKFIASIPYYLDMWRLLRRCDLQPARPDWMLGWRSVMQSLAISGTAVLDISRQQGLRIFLGTLVGITEMTEFATMRTLSNLPTQGIGAINNPAMPEVMKFLRERDSASVNAAMGFSWLLGVVVLAPLLIVFQWIMPAIFVVWTRGKIEFNPALFALFSVALLLFAVARPCATILQGNNLLKIQLRISIAMCAFAIPGIIALTLAFGIIGAGVTILLTEILGSVSIIWCAANWLKQHAIAFPTRLFAMALSSIALAAIATALMLYLPNVDETIVVVSLIVGGVNCIALLLQLAPAAVLPLRGLMRRF
jgi:O-antigen/teichoic acid export membrane protein